MKKPDSILVKDLTSSAWLNQFSRSVFYVTVECRILPLFNRCNWIYMMSALFTGRIIKINLCILVK